MHSFQQILLISLLSFTVGTSIGNVADVDHFKNNKNLRYQEVVDAVELNDSIDEYSHGGKTTVSPSPSVSPSSNANTNSPSPSVSPTPAPSDETVTPTTSPPSTAPPTTAPPTTAPPTTAPPTTAPPTTAPPSTAPPTPSPTHHPHHEWWKSLWKFLLKTVCWMFIAVLFFFAFGAVMSNRYRIYYYLRGSWYSLLQKLKWSRLSGRDGSAPSSTLNDIIFSDNDFQEGLLMRET